MKFERFLSPRMVSTLVILGAFVVASAAQAQQLHIVAVGDSNLAGKGVSRDQAYPAQLERALRAKGIDVVVANAGVNGDTTAGVLARLDSAVPNGTDIAIVSVGVNDVVLHGASPAAAKAGGDEVVRRLRARGIEVVRLGTGKDFQGSIRDKPEFHVEGGAGPAKGTTNWHLTPEGYAIVVAQTLPQVMAAISQVKNKRAKQ